MYLIILFVLPAGFTSYYNSDFVICALWQATAALRGRIPAVGVGVRPTGQAAYARLLGAALRAGHR